MKLSELINERFVNLNSNQLIDYIDPVWNILQKSYAPIGGFKTASSRQDLLKKVNFAKLVKKNDKIIAVRLYKDQNGRKGIAGGTDGSGTFTVVVGDTITVNHVSGPKATGICRSVSANIGTSPGGGQYASQSGFGVNVTATATYTIVSGTASTIYAQAGFGKA
jgi:hypothetical protein